MLSHVAAVRIALTGGFDGLRSGTTKERSQFYKNLAPYFWVPAAQTPSSRRAAPHDITATDED